MKRSFAPLMLVLTLGPGPLLAHAAVIKVPDPGSGIYTLQDGIDVASPGDEVVVAPGSYDLVTIDKEITLRSQFGADVTTIQGEPYAGARVWFESVGNGAVLRGFTITGSGLFPGVCLVDASPIIEENTIEGNFAGGTGGGIYGYQSSPIIRHNRIRNNGCYSITPHRSAQGAGIYLKGETITPRIHGNFILDNDAHCGMGMCLGIYGGGIYVEGGSPRIVGNVIAGNRVDGGEIWEFGGAIYLEGVQDAVVANNTIHDNEADTGTHPVIGNYGGAVFLVSSSGDFLFANNIVHASSGAGVRCGEDVTGQIHRTNALYDNPDGDFLDCPIALGDLYVDPQMVDPAGGDYRLADTSPLIDAGTSGVPGLTLTDIYGAGRVIDGDGDGTAVVDIGAAEHGPPPGWDIGLSEAHAAAATSGNHRASKTFNALAFIVVPALAVAAWRRRRLP